MNQIVDWLVPLSLSLLAIVGSILLGLLVRKFLKSQEEKLTKQYHGKKFATSIQTQFAIIRHLVMPLILFIGIIIVCMSFEPLRGLGTTFLASAGLYGIVAGFAARSTLSNLIAGIMLAFAQPIRVGDIAMIDKEYGTIEDITLMYTYLRTWDNRRLVIPNEIMSNEKILNYSIRDARIWARVNIYLDYSVDVDETREVLVKLIKESPYLEKGDEPQLWLMELGERYMEFWFAGWAKDPLDAWMLRCDMREKALKEFQARGLPLPRFRLQPMAPPDDEMDLLSARMTTEKGG